MLTLMPSCLTWITILGGGSLGDAYGKMQRKNSVAVGSNVDVIIMSSWMTILGGGPLSDTYSNMQRISSVAVGSYASVSVMSIF